MGAPRRTLVDHLVDDPKSRTILHVWAARAQGRRKIIFPQTLSMSLAHGSHGLANQIWSLVGYCVLAHLMSAELVLPTWAWTARGASWNSVSSLTLSILSGP